MKRLPVWGKKVKDDEMNFEWPTQEILDKLSPDVFLKSLDLKVVGDYELSSV